MRCGSRPKPTQMWCSSTSACQASTAPTSSGVCGRGPPLPIIILSVRDAESDKVAALDAGADDYVTKPFGINELLARLRAALRRRSPGVDAAVVRTTAFAVDLAAHRVWRDGEEVHLTPKQWELVKHLVSNPGRLLTQRWLLEEIWGPAYGEETGYLRATWPSCAASSNPTRAGPATSSPSPGWGIASSRTSPVRRSRNSRQADVAVPAMLTRPSDARLGSEPILLQREEQVEDRRAGRAGSALIHRTFCSLTCSSRDLVSG